MSIWKQGVTIAVSPEVLADIPDGGFFRVMADEAAWAYGEWVENGHIGPIHKPTRSTLADVLAAQRRRVAFASHIRCLVGNRKPGTFRRAA